jgi:uncharacterized protein YbaR (Trm112 family)
MFPDLLHILHCPDCSGELGVIDNNGSSVHCRLCGGEFPVIDGIPVLFPTRTAAATASGNEPQ